MKEGLLIVVSGPSGAGKGTICKHLLKKNNKIDVSVSMTTRKPRKGEVDGVNYFFVDKEKFTTMIDQDGFLEYAEVYGNYYGTPNEYVQEKIKQGRNVLLEIDIQGALKVKEKYPDGVYIFILPPSMTELKNRIVKRGSETKESLNRRFSSAYSELEYIFKYDYGVVNDEVDLAVNKVESIITAEKCKVSRHPNIIKQL